MKIAVTTVAFSKNEELRERLSSKFKNVKFNEEGKRFTREELIVYLQGIDAAIVGLDKIDSELLDKCPKLKFISKFGVGLDNIDLTACEAKRVGVGWTAGVNKTSVAELTLGFMLSLSRNISFTNVQLKRGQWLKNGGMQLSGKTVGIIGLGNIGTEVAKFLSMFKCNILVNDVVDVSEKCERMKLKFVDKETIFKESDLITVHTPLDNTTKHMICSDSISIMKNGVLLINTARGSIFNLDAVEVALEQGKLGGVALDVYDEEPPQRWLLIDDARVICTPHIGGNASEAVLAMGVSAIKHIEGHLKSGVPE